VGRETDIFSLYPETIVAASGVTIIFQPIQGQVSATVKYGSGGTLFFYGATQSFGASFSTAAKFLIGSGEVYTFDSSGNFSIGIEGATTTFYVLRGRSAGFTQT
jgi:hypothetical protein